MSTLLVWQVLAHRIDGKQIFAGFPRAVEATVFPVPFLEESPLGLSHTEVGKEYGESDWVTKLLDRMQDIPCIRSVGGGG